MVQIFLLIFILLLPVSSEAAYTIYLKNGSEISGVSSYEKKDGEVIIYFGGGSIGIPENDIIKIESIETTEKDFSKEEITAPETEQPAPSAVPAEEPPATEKSDRANRLQADLDAINADLKTIGDDEVRVKTSIDEKMSARSRYNPYQRYLIEKDIEPLQEELSTIQQKKGELLQRKAYIEGELKSLK